jgi:small redox-active disulfide protein 2
MEIRILGTGCAKCEKLEKETRLVAEEMGLDFNLEKVSELQEIMKYGVMLTPALVVDDEVKVVGKVPARDEIKKLLG